MQALPVYTDFNSLNALRADTGATQAEKLENAARQFSAVFTNMLLKSMRQASLGEGIFDTQQSTLYRDLFDSQIALQLSQGQSLGIAELLVNQFTDAGTDAGNVDSAGRVSRAAAAADVYATVSGFTGETQESVSAADSLKALSGALK